MKKSAIIALMCFACFVTAENAESAGASVQLLENGSLETLDATGWPVGWPQAKNVSCETEDGGHFLRISSGGTESMDMVYMAIPLPARTSTVRLSFRERHAGVKSGRQEWNDARIIVNAIDDSGRKSQVGAPYFRGSSDGWKSFALDFMIPAGSTTLELMPCMFNAEAGTLDIDDISVTAKVRAPAATALAADDTPVAKGAKIFSLGGRELRFRGLNIPSLEWNWRGEHVIESVDAAIETWRANLLRIPLNDKFWFGRGAELNDWNAQDDGGEGYRRIVDSVIERANDAGCYVLLDLHCYVTPTAEHAEFWKDAAKRYANRPGVMFDLLNEPHDTTWRVWKSGGIVPGRDGAKPVHSIGMQALVDAVRATGAKNLVVCGGLDWAYDLSGVAEGYALADDSGNGIAYSAHVYPWKKDWDGALLAAAREHPVIIGEVGCQEEPMAWETAPQNPYKWAPDAMSYIEGNGFHWIAWSFHPSAGPCVISDWDYTPTPYWGSFVRAALEGARFQPGSKH